MLASVSILDGYIMVAIVYFTNNLLLFSTLRERMRISWLLLVALTLAQSIAVYHILHYFWAGNLLVLFLFFLIFCKAVDVEAYKLMCVNMVTTAYTTVCNLVFFMVWGHAYTWAWRETGLMLLVFALISPIVGYWLRKVLWPRLSRLNLPGARGLWILPALVITIAILIGSAHIQKLLAGYETVFGATAILLVIFSSGVGLMMLMCIEKNQTVINQRNDLHVMDMQIAAQSRRYSELVQHIDEIRVMRHDMRHHVRTAAQLLETGRIDELHSFLQQIESCETLHDNIVYSHNYISDLVAHHSLHVARDAGISVTVQCGLPKYFWVSDTDLCVLLGNLMENALNACRLQTEGPREIAALSVVRGEEAFIRIENSCSSVLQDTSERRKACGLLESGGYGMVSVHAIAAKYGGMAVFSRQGTRFVSFVLLHKPESGVTRTNPTHTARAVSEMRDAI